MLSRRRLLVQHQRRNRPSNRSWLAILFNPLVLAHGLIGDSVLRVDRAAEALLWSAETAIEQSCRCRNPRCRWRFLVAHDRIQRLNRVLAARARELANVSDFARPPSGISALAFHEW